VNHKNYFHKNPKILKDFLRSYDTSIEQSPEVGDEKIRYEPKGKGYHN